MTIPWQATASAPSDLSEDGHVNGLISGLRITMNYADFLLSRVLWSVHVAGISLYSLVNLQNIYIRQKTYNYLSILFPAVLRLYLGNISCLFIVFLPTYIKSVLNTGLTPHEGHGRRHSLSSLISHHKPPVPWKMALSCPFPCHDMLVG